MEANWKLGRSAENAERHTISEFSLPRLIKYMIADFDTKIQNSLTGNWITFRSPEPPLGNFNHSAEEDSN